MSIARRRVELTAFGDIGVPQMPKAIKSNVLNNVCVF
jgi:hypothetical protein